jgi:O-antigen/teichoic acid export membrane protein
MPLFNSSQKLFFSLISFRTAITLFNAILNLVFLRIVVEKIGLEEVGIYFVLISVGQILSTLDLGLSYRASIIFGSKTEEISTRAFLGIVVWRIAIVQSLITSSMLGILPILNLVLFHKFSYDNISLFFIVFITSIFLSIFSLFNQYFIVRAELHRLLIIDFWRNLSTFLLSILFISYSKSLLSLILAWSVANIVPNLIYIFRYFRSTLSREIIELSNVPDFPFLKSEGVHNQFSVIGGVLNNSSDQIVLSAVLGPSFVTSYQILTRALVFLRAILGIVWLQLWPLLTFGIQDILKRRESRSLIRMTIFVGSIFALSYSLGGNSFVRIFIAENTALTFSSYLAVGILGIVLAAEIIVSAGTMELRFQRVKQWLVLLSGFANVLLSAYFARVFGVSGCIISSILIISFLYVLPLGFIRRDFWRNIFN